MSTIECGQMLLLICMAGPHIPAGYEDYVVPFLWGTLAALFLALLRWLRWLERARADRGDKARKVGRREKDLRVLDRSCVLHELHLVESW